MLKQLWQRRPGAIFFLLTSTAIWGAVSLRWITEFREHNHPLTGAITLILLLFGLLLGLEPLLTRPSLALAHLYLAVQTGLIFAASLLFFELDFFALLYVPIVGQAIYLLPRRAGRVWVAVLVGFTAVGQYFQFGLPDAFSFMLLYAAALIFVAAFVTMVLQAEAARQRSERLLAELETTHAQLQQYTNQAEELAIANERTRLARDLHDSVAQTLYGLGLRAEAARRKLSAGQTAAVSNYLDEIQADAQQTLQETRLLIFELRPPLLESKGLAGALRTRLQAVEARSSLTMHLDLQELPDLPETVETGLYRIAQEALNNAAKYARARTLRVVLHRDDGLVRLEIADDGIGFDATQAPAGSVGLHSMAERAAQINGRFTIDSAPQQGTTILVEVPL